MDDVLGAVARVDFAGEEDEPMSHDRVPSDGVQLRVRRCGRRDHRLAECSDSEKLGDKRAPSNFVICLARAFDPNNFYEALR